MARKAVIIAYPGEKGNDNYCNGVNVDAELYYSFLTSPIGGAWYANEIAILRAPSASQVRAAIQGCTAASYSFVAFCGHGFYSAQRQSTIVELNAKETLDSAELRAGAGKHSLVLDCCRVVAKEVVLTEALAKAMRAEAHVDPARCRAAFDARLAECPSGLAVLYACSINQTAGDDATRGGYYSSSLLGAASNWVSSQSSGQRLQPNIFSIVEAHDEAVGRVARLSGGRQNPTIEKPRSGKYFPFSVIA